MTREWSPTLPAGGIALAGLSIVGDGKDLEMRVDRPGRTRLVIPLSDAGVSTGEGVTLDVRRIDDRSLSLVYSAPTGLLLTDLHVRWDEDEWTMSLHDVLATLFGTVRPDSSPSPRLDACVRAEVSLSAGLTDRRTEEQGQA
ncbi:hypothetical protein [Nocardiopsis ansamitocini]|uniref:Uncharacterized protein n=1 Tax=Nocardiopsis ansamitocini TaxID=1670832 RepID=A0A9W6PBL1_9ACTN|nr:hypothetical protein [Nocardiopsis ansamitocini]GLU50528.1 hypothetical protein Nans01_48790 [Nocardiopsis ansamitocini]